MRVFLKRSASGGQFSFHPLNFCHFRAFGAFLCQNVRRKAWIAWIGLTVLVDRATACSGPWLYSLGMKLMSHASVTGIISKSLKVR